MLTWVEMQKLSLPSCISPKDKAEVLIKAHKLVVGTSLLNERESRRLTQV